MVTTQEAAYLCRITVDQFRYAARKFSIKNVKKYGPVKLYNEDQLVIINDFYTRKREKEEASCS